jgi:plasmid stabilization system protein ParE
VQVAWSAAALRDVAGIYQYITDFNPLAARQLAAALLDLGDSLESMPHRGRRVGNLLELVAVYPYKIRYRVSRDAVVILRVRHGARRPLA